MGGVVHFEIPADDQERARKFYQEVLGWRIDPVPRMDYNMVVTTTTDESGRPTEPGAINGGMVAREPDLKTPVITVDVPDINATLATVESLGGAVIRPRETIPGMGSYAYFKDTEGNVMGLWESLPAEQAGQASGSQAAANDLGA